MVVYSILLSPIDNRHVCTQNFGLDMLLDCLRFRSYFGSCSRLTIRLVGCYVCILNSWIIVVPCKVYLLFFIEQFGLFGWYLAVLRYENLVLVIGDIRLYRCCTRLVVDCSKCVYSYLF